ncbi:hypothetical protein ACFWPK_34435 [Nocardia sp. NPDC058519]|uniref:hypothetical protein n=1 Tax=Nocardia sp. NPDC058519 TaxID=3346535 RepID=UPI0036665916
MASDRETLTGLIYGERLYATRDQCEEAAKRLNAVGVRPPAREITDYSEFTNMPVGTVVMGTDTCTVWQRVTDGWLWVGHNIPAYHYEVFRDDKSVTVLYVPTEETDCRHDSRSGAGGRWRCDQCDTDCGPDTYLTPTEEKSRG